MRGIKVALFLKRRYYDWESIILQLLRQMIVLFMSVKEL